MLKIHTLISLTISAIISFFCSLDTSSCWLRRCWKRLLRVLAASSRSTCASLSNFCSISCRRLSYSSTVIYITPLYRSTRPVCCMASCSFLNWWRVPIRTPSMRRFLTHNNVYDPVMLSIPYLSFPLTLLSLVAISPLGRGGTSVIRTEDESYICHSNNTIVINVKTKPFYCSHYRSLHHLVDQVSCITLLTTFMIYCMTHLPNDSLLRLAGIALS